jgi:DNA-binding SARP family transcriptional activator
MGQWTKARIQLCGRFVADIDGSRIEDALPGRIGRVLFAYLVLNRARPVPRDTLLMAGWGEDAPAETRNALNVLLSKLRHGLGAEHLRGRTEIELLLAAGDFVDAEAALEGAHRAESAIAEGTVGSGMGPGRDRLSRRHQAVPRPAWRRPGIDEWRRRLEEVRLRGLECFAAASLGLGGPALAQAEERARMLTELAPYRETGHRLLMEALARRGNVAEALRAYERLRVLLREELGIAPSPTCRASTGRLLENAGQLELLGLREEVLARHVANQLGCKTPIWPCAFFQSSSSSSPWMTYPHMQMILSAIANLQVNPLPSSRAVAEGATRHSDLAS